MTGGVKREFCRRLYKHPPRSATPNVETLVCEEVLFLMQCV